MINNNVNNIDEYFNNLVNKENISALMIQYNWKQYLLLKKHKSLQNKDNNIILYISTMTGDSSKKSSNYKIENSLKNRHITYKLIDISMDKNIRETIPITNIETPLLKIGDMYINECYIFDILDKKILEDVLKKEYYIKCLNCFRIRNSIEENNCYFCGYNYEYFKIKY